METNNDYKHLYTEQEGNRWSELADSQESLNLSEEAEFKKLSELIKADSDLETLIISGQADEALYFNETFIVNHPDRVALSDNSNDIIQNIEENNLESISPSNTMINTTMIDATKIDGCEVVTGSVELSSDYLENEEQVATLYEENGECSR